MKIMEIFDYTACIKALSQHKDLKYAQFAEFYLIHLFTTAENGQSSIVRKINKKRDVLQSVPNRNPGIQLFSAKKMD